MPKSQREEWNTEYTGPLWEWTLRAAAAGTPDSRFAIDDHLKRAWGASIKARFSRGLFGSPRFCVGFSAALLILLVAASGGLPVLRHWTHKLPYRDPSRMVILAQGPPYFGMRLGFRDREIETFRTHVPSFESLASYTWSPTVFSAGPASASHPHHREIIMAEVSPGFFDVLGVGPAIGSGLREIPRDAAVETSATNNSNEDETFLASDEFWRKDLGARPTAIGQRFEIGGRFLRLAGILPRGFTFLSTPIAVWTAAPPEPPIPPRRWWLVLRGGVARLRPGIAPAAAEKEMLKALKDAHIARVNFQVRATPVADLVYRPAWSYGTDFAVSFGAVFLWAAFNMVRDRRRGASWQIVRGYWGFFVGKTLLPLLAFFVLVLEFSGVARLGVTGGIPPGQGPLSIWFFYCGLALILMWAWRDQPRRCRVCLHRMQNPIRIGVPGQVLLETAGQEVMCPYGHGSVFTSESVLGADISDRWMGFP